MPQDPRSPQPIEIQQVELPSGGGAIHDMGEAFQADQFTGDAGLSVPLPASPSRGFEPRLSLDYSSLAGNSSFGMGFTPPTSSIARRTSKHVPRYRDDDTFVWDGTVLVLLDGESTERTVDGVSYTVRRYQTQLEGGFTRIEHWQADTGPSFWRLLDRSDISFFFGQSTEARIVNPGNPSQIFEWLLEVVFDPKGNARHYRYKEENTQNIPNVLYEHGRTQDAQRYLERVHYGNVAPYQPPNGGIGAPPPTDWHFETVFDYGEYDIRPENDNPYQPVRSWPARPDPFSTYKAGFEIRTHRLCHNVLRFHRFPQELGEEPMLVGVTAFDYDQNPTLSRLRSVSTLGYRHRPEQPEGQRYQVEALPPLEFGFVAFEPEERFFAPLTETDLQSLPGLDRPPNYHFVDLYGEGLPGVLYADGDTVRYWHAVTGQDEQPIAYDLENPSTFPLPRRVDGASHHLMDLDGNGSLDYVETLPGASGFFENQEPEGWRPFVPFESFPSDFFQPAARFADLTGDGRSDLLLLLQETVRYYPSLGTDGFGPAVERPHEPSLPLPSGSLRSKTLFTDLTGSGTAHLVRLYSGRVECWPNLGYGRFGTPFQMANAPHFGEEVGIDRVFLADLDGSGTADLVIAHADRLLIYWNHSGNAFSVLPHEVPLPAPCASAAQIQAADVYGNGYAALVFTFDDPTPKQWALDLCGGKKPYLLNSVDNHLGARTRITYTSSTRYYLRDQHNGRPWVTRLPFPVQLVERIEAWDEISQSRKTSTFAYRDGYYDPVEREFRGFALVESLDVEVYEEFNDPEWGREGTSQDTAQSVAPRLTRTWYDTGAFLAEPALERQLQSESFSEDPDAYPMPTAHFQWRGLPHDTATERQARAALRGRTLRREVYGLDGQQVQGVPYQVEDYGYTVRLLQSKGQHPYAVFLVFEREGLSYDYEREADDPRVHHQFTLEVDDYGEVIRSCSIAYARRPDVQQTIEPQRRTWVSCTLNDYLPAQDRPDEWLFGVLRQSRLYSLHDLSPPNVEGLYYSFTAIERQVARALDGQGPGTAQLETWNRAIWLGRDGEEAPPGELAPQLLLLQTQEAAFSAEEIQDLFADLPFPEGLEAFLKEEGGYRFDPTNGYWWRPGMRQSYLPAQSFFLPNTTADPFAAGDGKRSGTVNTYGYDPYFLLLTQLYSQGSAGDVLPHTTAVTRIDYQTLHPVQIRNPNGNFAEVIEDPLGRVQVTSTYGTEWSGKKEKPTGFTPLPLDDPASWPQPPSLAQLIDDPETYLRGAATFVYYDDTAWMEGLGPATTARVVAQKYPLPSSENTPSAKPQIHLLFADGFGRELQTKIKAPPGEAFLVDAGGTPQLDSAGRLERGFSEERWQTSGRKRYNNKGEPFKSYEPYFLSTWRYVDNEELNTFGVSLTLYYDPLNRPIRVDHPKAPFEQAFFSRTTYGAWQDSSYDLDDTVKDSRYYQYYIDEGNPLPEAERQALLSAAEFFDTPTTQRRDSLGRTVQQVARLEPGDDDALVTHWEFDLLGRELWSADPRLAPRGVTNFHYRYGMSGQVLFRESVDAGPRHSLVDVLGKPLFDYDGRGTRTLVDYDSYQRPWGVRVSGKVTANRELLVTRTVYGDSLDAQGEPVTPGEVKGRNLMGQVLAMFDQAGFAYSESYTLTGNAATDTRALRRNYKGTADWAVEPPPSTWRQLIDALEPQLEREEFKRQISFDALARPVRTVDPAGNITRHKYLISGLLSSLDWAPKGASPSPYVLGIEYDAKNQRQHITYADPEGGELLHTRYIYDPDTFRLDTIHTERLTDGKLLQGLRYTYDPVGNITQVTDEAAPSPKVIHRQQVVTPQRTFTYDALYRLTEATGRALAGYSRIDQRAGGYAPYFDGQNGDHPNDAQALENYRMAYRYDNGGNLRRMNYSAPSSSWSREFKVAETSNRAVDMELLGTQPVDSFFDGNGNQIRMEGLDPVVWSYRNTLSSLTFVQRTEADSDAQFFNYDATGKRVRKVTETLVGSSTQFEETLYFGGFEISRRRQGTNVSEVLHRIRLEDGERSFVERLEWIVGTPPSGVPNPQNRYQLTDFLGSATLEISADGSLISYEEYAPYGATVYAAGPSLREVSLKQYRYSGKERDARSGLYYYGARYYAPWLGRWLSPDPAGTLDGLNLYAFVGGNPVRFQDIGGYGKGTPSKAGAAKKKQDARTLARTHLGKKRNEFYPKLRGIAAAARTGDPKARQLAAKIADEFESDPDFKVEVAKRVRVRATRAGGAKKGYGRDEVFKTSKTGMYLRRSAGLVPGVQPTSSVVDSSGNTQDMDWLDLQEQVRFDTSTVLTKEGGGHTGALRATTSSKGYMTEGQANLHEKRQEAIEKSSTPRNALLRGLHAHLQVTPTPMQVDDFDEGFDVRNRDLADDTDRQDIVDQQGRVRDATKQALELFTAHTSDAVPASPVHAPLSPRHDPSYEYTDSSAFAGLVSPEDMRDLLPTFSGTLS